MNIYELNAQRRTVRKFSQKPLDETFLTNLVDAARLCPSAANLQPLRYRIISGPEDCAALFPHLRWAGYLKDGAPAVEERPTAYIIVAQDMTARPTESSYDVGAAMMTMTLLAQESGIGCCWFGSIDRKAVQQMYALDEKLQIALILALGYPAQQSVAEPIKDNNIRYWLDEHGVLHVPKQSLEDVLF